MSQRFSKLFMEHCPSYFAAVKFLEDLANVPAKHDYMAGKKHTDIYLKRVRYFLNLLGNPERGFKFIHITGTAGKGSVACMSQEVLVAAGNNTGLFTSPFCQTSIEKIKVNNQYISPQEFADIVTYLKPFIKKAYSQSPYGGPSYFELFWVLALVYFQKKHCEWVVAEVGAGGRYDATNIITRPVITAITNIHFDHMNLLGNTLREIAIDKAGIIKKGSAFFTTEKRPRLLKIFEKTCQEVGASFHTVIPSASFWQSSKTVFSWLRNSAPPTNVGGPASPLEVDAKAAARPASNSPRSRKYCLPSFASQRKRFVPGQHQLLNVALVTAMAKYLGIYDQATKAGISRARLPCRFEIVQKNPLVILDGAHNEIKIQSVVANLGNLKFRKLLLVFGIAHDKKIKAIIPRLMPLADKIFFTSFSIPMKGRTCRAPKKMARLSLKYKKPQAQFEVFDDPKKALERALSLAAPDDCVLVTGSFFLAGELRNKWFPEKQILKKRKSF